MKRTALFIFCAFFTMTMVFAQGTPVLKFEKTTHDFGDITEEDGDAVCEFKITNTGDAPLVISRATASCGCTTPIWTKEPIAPGQNGKITTTYATKGRPGPFSKTITVYSNASNNATVLSIKGDVVPKKLTPEEAYPIQMGNLRLQQTNVNFGLVAITEQKSQTIEVYNSGKTPLSLKFEKLPKYMTASVEPASIPVNTAGKIVLKFNAPVAKTYGKIAGSFEISGYGNTKTPTDNKIQYETLIADDFKSIDKSKCPKLGLNQSLIKFGQLSAPGTPSTQILKVSNSGTAGLIIRSAQSNSPEVTATIMQTTIKPGEIGDIKLVANTKKVKQSISGVLTIITNDPENPMREVRFAVRP